MKTTKCSKKFYKANFQQGTLNFFLKVLKFNRPNAQISNSMDTIYLS
jgi:hypothetical protein